MTFEEIYTKYKPKEGYSIYALISKHTGRYIASVYRKDTVNIYKREFCMSSVANISTDNIDKYLKFIEPYVEERSL